MRRKYLFIFVIIFVVLLFTQISAKTIYIIKDSEGNTVTVTDENYLTPEQIEEGYTITVFLESSAPTKPSQTPSSPPMQFVPEQQVVDEEIKQVDLLREVTLLELSSKYIDEGSKIEIDGVIKNYGQYTIHDAQINIECINESGKLTSAQSVPTNPPDIMPKGQVYFNAILSNKERIIRYNVSIYDKYLKTEYLHQLKAKVEVPDWSSSISKKGDYICPEGRACFYCEEDGEFILLNGTLKNVGDGYMTKTDIHIIGRDFINRSVASASGKPKSLDLAPGKTVNFSGILHTNGKSIDNFILEISWINPQGNKSGEQTIELKRH